MKIVFTLLLFIFTVSLQSQNLINIDVDKSDPRSDIQIINDTLDIVLTNFHANRVNNDTQITAGNIQITRVDGLYSKPIGDKLSSRDNSNSLYNFKGSALKKNKKQKKLVRFKPRQKRSRISKYSKCYTF